MDLYSLQMMMYIILKEVLFLSTEIGMMKVFNFGLAKYPEDSTLQQYMLLKLLTPNLYSDSNMLLEKDVIGYG